MGTVIKVKALEKFKSLNFLVISEKCTAVYSFF